MAIVADSMKLLGGDPIDEFRIDAAPSLGGDPGDGSDIQYQQGPRTYGEFNVELPEELQNALRDLVHEAQREDLYQRRIEVMRDRRNRFYERGIQHIYEDLSGAFVLSTPGQLVPDPTSPGSSIQCGQFINDYNIFGRCLQIIIAKLTENPPGVVFEADSDNPVDDQAKTAGESYRIQFERQNDVDDIMTAVYRMMGLSGRTVAWTHTEDGQEICCVYGTLETKCPVMARSLKDCPYFIITEDPHVYNVKMDHPDFADKICEQGDDGIADSQFERLARIGALQGQSASFQVTDTYNYYVEDKHIWFRLAMFTSKRLDSQYVDTDDNGQATQRTNDDGDPWTLRDALKEAFPDGCYVEFIGNQYVGSANEGMDEHLAMDFPYAGEGAARMAIMDPAVPIQDDFNDALNNFHEVMVTGWPSTWINEDLVNLKFINDQTAAPYCFRALKSRPPRDGSMEAAFYREPNPEIPASFLEFVQYEATNLLQFILAIPSAVQGAGMPDQKTKGGYQEAIVQAMGQLGVLLRAAQRLYSKIIKQAAMCAAKRSQDTLAIPSKAGNVTLRMADLSAGKFSAHPDKDSGFPESTMQIRGTLQQALAMILPNPVVAQAVLSSPDNWDYIFKIMGLRLTIPEAVVRRKQVAEIELLLQQSPQGPTPEEMAEAQAQHASDAMMAQAGGQGAQPFDQMSLMKSSIQPGPLDYHEWEFEECREFLSDWAKVQQQLSAGNEAGVMNVQLHAQEHQKLMAAQQMQLAAARAAAVQKVQPSTGGEQNQKPNNQQQEQPPMAA